MKTLGLLGIKTLGNKDIGTFRLIEVRFSYRLNVLTS